MALADLAGALLDDPRVTALGLYIEGIDDAPAFAALAQRARARGKGIVAIKSGKTEMSRTAAASHTASLAGGGAASSAFLRQIGVAEVNSRRVTNLGTFRAYVERYLRSHPRLTLVTTGTKELISAALVAVVDCSAM